MATRPPLRLSALQVKDEEFINVLGLETKLCRAGKMFELRRKTHGIVEEG